MTAQRPSVHPLRPRLLPIPLAIAATLLIAIPPATAGIRDMVKSAKDKAAQKTAGKSGTGEQPCDQVEFTDVVIELTGERLDKFIAGLEASAPIEGEQGKLILRRDEVHAQISALNGKHGQAIADARQKRDEHGQCFHRAVDQSRSQRMDAERDQQLANPASAEKWLKAIARLNDARVKGDKAAELKAQEELDVLTGPTRADTLAARQKCGPAPAPHPQALRIDALEQESTAIDERIRELDMKARKLESETSGLTPEQFAMVRERAERFLASEASHGRAMCFTAAEREALAAHKEALEKALEA